MTHVWSPRAQCDGKIGYTTKKAAKLAARRYETHWGGGRCDAYACPHCGPGTWHIGHPRFKRNPNA